MKLERVMNRKIAPSIQPIIRLIVKSFAISRKVSSDDILTGKFTSFMLYQSGIGRASLARLCVRPEVPEYGEKDSCEEERQYAPECQIPQASNDHYATDSEE